MPGNKNKLFQFGSFVLNGFYQPPMVAKVQKWKCIIYDISGNKNKNWDIYFTYLDIPDIHKLINYFSYS